MRLERQVNPYFAVYIARHLALDRRWMVPCLASHSIYDQQRNRSSQTDKDNEANQAAERTEQTIYTETAYSSQDNIIQY